MYPDIPGLKYQKYMNQTVALKADEASTYFEFTFTDGDGDIANDPQNLTNELFFRDMRDTNSKVAYHFGLPIPYVSDDKRSKKGGLEGRLRINLGKQYYNNIDSTHLSLGRDTLVWNVFIIDRAGNKSNVVATDTVFIIP